MRSLKLGLHSGVMATEHQVLDMVAKAGMVIDKFLTYPVRMVDMAVTAILPLLKHLLVVS